MQKLVITLLAVLLITACTKDKGFPKVYSTNKSNDSTVFNPCNPTSDVSFSLYVQPTLSVNCLPCHAYPNSSGISLDSYDRIKYATTNNTLIDVLNGANGLTLMPPTGKLDSCTIHAITLWVSQGTKNN